MKGCEVLGSTEEADSDSTGAGREVDASVKGKSLGAELVTAGPGSATELPPTFSKSFTAKARCLL